MNFNGFKTNILTKHFLLKLSQDWYLKVLFKFCFKKIERKVVIVTMRFSLPKKHNKLYNYYKVNSLLKNFQRKKYNELLGTLWKQIKSSSSH